MQHTFDRTFFNRPTVTVAKELLGKFLVRKIGWLTIAAMITEVEAYIGPHDMASHASRGRTPRNGVMFGHAGRWYVYLIYGMHHCLNIVTERQGYPAAILIRSIIPARTKKLSIKKRSFVNAVIGSAIRIAGPGKVCRYFKIDRRLDKKPASRASGLWIEDRGMKINPRRIRRGKRIGVDYAGEWKEKLWRFSVQ